MADYTIEELQDMLEEKLIKEEQEFQASLTSSNAYLFEQDQLQQFLRL